MNREAEELPLFNENESEQSSIVLLEQYKLYVQLADNLSTRRAQANSFFLTINTAFLTTLTAIISFSKEPLAQTGGIVLACITGIILNIAWYSLVTSYRRLSSSKFSIIQKIEAKLPLRLFESEWLALKAFTPLTVIEQRVPIVFLALYIILIALVLVSWFFDVKISLAALMLASRHHFFA
jgi:hypothetical protein